MKDSLLKIDRELKMHWKNYVFQSLFAAVILFIVLLVLNINENPIIITSIGATTFIVFAMPKDITAKSRNIIGGHVTGFLTGSLLSLIPHSSSLTAYMIYALAVGLSLFIMVVTDTEHPPASGTALGIAIKGFSLDAAIAVMISVIALSLIHHFFKSHLRNLV